MCTWDKLKISIFTSTFLQLSSQFRSIKMERGGFEIICWIKSCELKALTLSLYSSKQQNRRAHSCTSAATAAVKARKSIENDEHFYSTHFGHANTNTLEKRVAAHTHYVRVKFNTAEADHSFLMCFCCCLSSRSRQNRTDSSLISLT